MKTLQIKLSISGERLEGLCLLAKSTSKKDLSDTARKIALETIDKAIVVTKQLKKAMDDLKELGIEPDERAVKEMIENGGDEKE